MSKDTLTITDNRTGKHCEIAITDGTIRAMELRQLKSGPDDFGLLTYDPAFMNTASTRSAITFIDGDRGMLWYRGYPIEQLAERPRFLGVANPWFCAGYPTRKPLERGACRSPNTTGVHENWKGSMGAF